MAEATNYVPGLLHPDPSSIGDSDGSGGGQIVYYASDPNTESLTPDDPTAEAIAVSATGTGPSYVWVIGTQTWT